MVHAESTDERTDAAADRSIELALTAAGMMLEGGASAASVADAMRAIALAGGLTAGEYITTTLRRVSRPRRT